MFVVFVLFAVMADAQPPVLGGVEKADANNPEFKVEICLEDTSSEVSVASCSGAEQGTQRQLLRPYQGLSPLNNVARRSKRPRHRWSEAI